MKLTHLIPTLAIGLLAGCAVPRTVEILNAPPNRPYETLGPVRYSTPYQEWKENFEPDALDGLRKEAADMGANAVILKEHRIERTIPAHYTDVMQNEQRKPLEIASGTAIRYTTPPPAPAGNGP